MRSSLVQPRRRAALAAIVLLASCRSTSGAPNATWVDGFRPSWWLREKPEPIFGGRGDYKPALHILGAATELDSCARVFNRRVGTPLCPTRAMPRD
jgi:hypothetical protein